MYKPNNSSRGGGGRPNGTFSGQSRDNSSNGRNTNGNNRSNGNSYSSNGYSSSSQGFQSQKSYNNHHGNSPNYGNGNQRKQNEEIHLSKPVWNSSTMKPFEKQFYRESSLVYNRASNELDDFLRRNNVSVNGTTFIRPILNFNECDIPDSILNKIKDAKYDRPTPIQSMCWPTLLSGNDMVGIAQTGSGKTLGFILPMLLHIRNNTKYQKSLGDIRDEPGPIGLVLAPTRELAQQIQKTAEEFGNYTGIKNIVIYGGASKGPQISQIKRGAEIYIATPGRLLDFLKENIISLSKCTFLVLDEADRMLDMGFEPQIRKIIEQIRPDRQTTMFSATWPKEVRKLAEDFISNYAHITIGASELTANPNIKQIVELCEESNKENRLKEILNDIMNCRDSKAIIFAETKRRVDSYSKFIRDLGYHCLTIHGDKKQMEREWVLNEFKRKPKSILCATDVAARGINIEDIKYVINIDYPIQTEDYIHRIGRTARNSNSGTSFTFITNDNARHLPKLIEVLRESNQYVNENLVEMARPFMMGFKNNGRNFSRNYSNSGFQSRPKFNHQSNQQFNKGSGYNENIMPERMNLGPRKRDSSEMNNDDGNHKDSENSNNERNGRVKKFRWDEGPVVNGSQNQSRNFNSNGISNYSADLNNNNNRNQIQSLTQLSTTPSHSLTYGPYPPLPVSQKTSDPSNLSAPPASHQTSPALMATCTNSADYNSVYNLQYYQAIAAGAATNYGSSWQAPAVNQNWKSPSK